jgi:hypothetical protein
VGKVGGRYGYWLLKGNECCSAGGFLSNPLSGSVANNLKIEKSMCYGAGSGIVKSSKVLKGICEMTDREKMRKIIFLADRVH